MNLQIFTGAAPIVDLDRADDGCATNCKHVLCFTSMSMPGANQADQVIAHHVEASHPIELELVGETQRPTVIDGETTWNEDWNQPWLPFGYAANSRREANCERKA